MYIVQQLCMPQSSTDELLAKWERQLRKGVLHLLVLSLLDREETYGYKLIAGLSKQLGAEMAEGTIYPLLSRLQTDELISADWRIMDSGPARKYYRITNAGRELLAAMRNHWSNVNDSVERMKP